MYAWIYASTVRQFWKQMPKNAAHVCAAVEMASLAFIVSLATVALLAEHRYQWARQVFDSLKDKRRFAAFAVAFVVIHLALSKYYRWEAARKGDGIRFERSSKWPASIWAMMSTVFAIWASKEIH